MNGLMSLPHLQNTKNQQILEEWLAVTVLKKHTLLAVCHRPLVFKNILRLRNHTLKGYNFPISWPMSLVSFSGGKEPFKSLAHVLVAIRRAQFHKVSSLKRSLTYPQPSHF